MNNLNAKNNNNKFFRRSYNNKNRRKSKAYSLYGAFLHINKYLVKFIARLFIIYLIIFSMLLLLNRDILNTPQYIELSEDVKSEILLGYIGNEKVESFYLNKFLGEGCYTYTKFTGHTRQTQTFSNLFVKESKYFPIFGSGPWGSRKAFSTNSSHLTDKLKTSNNISDYTGNEAPAFLQNGKNSKLVVTQFLIEKNLNPVFVYENLQENFTKDNIRKDTLNLSGVYLILNKFTLDYYIGSASTNKFYSRFSNHLLNFNGSKVVKAAVKKYKLTNFAFIILELFPEIVTKENNKKLLDIEDFYLKSLLPNYNILTEAGNSFGYKHSEMTRIKMKDSYSIERRLNVGNLNKGRIYTNEERKKLSLIAQNRKKAVYSEEGVINMKKKSKPIIAYNFDGTVYGEFSSIIEGAKALKCHDKTIRRALITPKQILRRR
jgi:group I intron endonuclease